MIEHLKQDSVEHQEVIQKYKKQAAANLKILKSVQSADVSRIGT